MAASSMSAQVKRARFAFTSFLLLRRWVRSVDRQPGGLERSLALRPRLAAGLPLDDRGSGLASWPIPDTVPHLRTVPNGPCVLRCHSFGSVRARTTQMRPVADQAVARRPAADSRVPRRIAAAITKATPTPMITSPTLKTFANGSHGGSAKMSVSAARLGFATTELLE